MLNNIENQILENIQTHQKLLNDKDLIKKVKIIIENILKAYKNGNKVMFCGNGGSAADAQHLAAELVSRFKLERKGLPAIALTTDTSIMTAISNDYNYEKVFERQIEALGNKGDVLIGISTSGNSINITNAFKAAQNKGMITIGLLGKTGGKNKEYCDIALVVPSDNTPRIQESHIMIGHIICDLVEQQLFSGDNDE